MLIGATGHIKLTDFGLSEVSLARELNENDLLTPQPSRPSLSPTNRDSNYSTQSRLRLIGRTPGQVRSLTCDWQEQIGSNSAAKFRSRSVSCQPIQEKSTEEVICQKLSFNEGDSSCSTSPVKPSFKAPQIDPDDITSDSDIDSVSPDLRNSLPKRFECSTPTRRKKIQSPRSLRKFDKFRPKSSTIDSVSGAVKRELEKSSSLSSDGRQRAKSETKKIKQSHSLNINSPISSLSSSIAGLSISTTQSSRQKITQSQSSIQDSFEPHSPYESNLPPSQESFNDSTVSCLICQQPLVEPDTSHNCYLLNKLGPRKGVEFDGKTPQKFSDKWRHHFSESSSNEKQTPKNFPKIIRTNTPSLEEENKENVTPFNKRRSSRMTPLTRTETGLLGTPDYIAPELLNRAKHGEQVDFWALGCCFYQFLIGIPPFYDRTPQDIFKRIKSGEIEWPDEEEFLPSARNVIESLLEPDPGKRAMGEAVKNSDFFTELRWDDVLKQTPPFIQKFRKRLFVVFKMNEIYRNFLFQTQIPTTIFLTLKSATCVVISCYRQGQEQCNFSNKKFFTNLPLF